MDYYFFFFCFWYASPTLPEPQRCADISGFHLQWRGNSVVSLVSASIWLDRGNDFCLWNAALKLYSRSCFKFTCERVVAHSCLPAEAHQLWGDPAVSSPMCLKQCFPSAWSLVGRAACANPPHVGVLPLCRLVHQGSSWPAQHDMGPVWGCASFGCTGRAGKTRGASKAIIFAGVRVLADAHQKRSNLTICESPIEAS